MATKTESLEFIHRRVSANREGARAEAQDRIRSIQTSVQFAERAAHDYLDNEDIGHLSDLVSRLRDIAKTAGIAASTLDRIRLEIAKYEEVEAWVTAVNG